MPRPVLTSDLVALAIVTVCRETGEDPIECASGVAGRFRSRHITMWALLHVFPDMQPTLAAALAGAPGKPIYFYNNSRNNRQRAERFEFARKWWDADIYERVIAAIDPDNARRPKKLTEPEPKRTAVEVVRKAIEEVEDEKPVMDRWAGGADRRRMRPNESNDARWATQVRSNKDILAEAVRNTAAMQEKLPKEQDGDE